ncbi:outer membrane protein transport protein [Mucilaginibacter sp. RB4R14]|uniref:OmpP1/FadL family transporter n=1 Tax=Mucilaginibacter aurantiaciroseus TaxID=2949308 RepID=UPI0020907400|nr:outer membrane protein transport protein [Mucilaginibacter aurantiaciroseus]MCO5936036.1 outer membrane protein transport protein [Mucilaginibacter aurantiaciroseus]
MKKTLLLLIWLSPGIIYAQGFMVNLNGQKQIGMGHTGTGLLQDGASVVFNPGAMAMLSENYLQAGISPLFFKSGFQGAGASGTAFVKEKVATPFNAYAVWGPKAARWKVGLGVYTPFGGLIDWGSNWQGKYVLESLDLKAIFFQPTVSYKLTDYLSIGAGFVYNHASVDLQRAIPVSGPDGNPGQARLTGGGRGYGWNAGIFIKPSSKFTIGLDYRSQVNTTIKKGDAFFSVANSLQANFPQPNTFMAGIPLPANASIGFGYTPDAKWTVAFDANFVGWHSYKSLAFDYASNTSTLQDTYSPRNYKDAFSLRGGAQYKTSRKVAVRLGGGYASTAVNDGYVTPEVPDANRYYLTAGLGYKLTNKLDLDFSFEYEHLFSRFQTNIESNLSGTFKSNVYIPGVSLSYHW